MERERQNDICYHENYSFNYLNHSGCVHKPSDVLQSQGWALRKIQGSQVLWTCKTLWKLMISMKKLRFSSRPREKVRCQGPEHSPVDLGI